MSNPGSLIRSSVGITVVVIMGYLLSFAKEAVFAAFYGVTYQADAFVIAVETPMVLFAVVAVGVRTVALPIYTKRFEVSQDHATLFARNLLTIALIIASGFSGLGMLFTDGIIYLFAPGFNSTTHSLAVILLRIAFPMVIFTIQADIYNAILNAWKVFSWPQMASYFQNIMLIVVILLLTHSLGIYAAIIGTLLGTIAQCLYLLYLSRKHFAYRPHFDIKDPDIRRAGMMAVPVIIGVGSAQINRLINRVVASGLSVGSIASLNYASKLNGIFSGLLVQAIATVVFPSFASLVIKKDYHELNRLINSILSILLLIMMPLTAGLILCNKELVVLVFERGEFQRNAVTLTGNILVFYNIGLLFITAREIISRVYYSFNDTKIPMINSSIGIALNIVLNVLLSRLMGAPGLALATSISSAIICILLLLQLRSKYDGYHLKETRIAFVKSLVATLGMTLSLLVIRSMLLIGSTFLDILCSFVIGSIIYFFLLLILRSKEGLILLDVCMKQFKRISVSKSMSR